MNDLKSLAITVFSMAMGFGGQSLAAEQLDTTQCYSGTFTLINNAKDAMQVAGWAQNGIIMSHSPNKLLANAVVHCEGVEHGVGEGRDGYGLCRIMDEDGDVIVAEIPYKGFTYDVKFMAGTGKWAGVKGSLHSERIVRSKPGKAAMPGTYQGCRREVGSFELAK